MTKMEPDDIDLYADVENEFPSSSMEGSESGPPGDLYDDVLTSKEGLKPSMKEEASLGSLNKIGNHTGGSVNIPGRKYQVYVGNLTWWTTDADVADAVSSIVPDFIEVKFYENRANGQSKGFCAVSLGSEASARILLEKLPKKELHGQAPVVTYATKQALHQFEAQSKTRPTPQAPPNNGTAPPKPPPIPPQQTNSPRLLMRNVRPPFPPTPLYQRPPPPTPNRLPPPPNLRAPPPQAVSSSLMVAIPPPRGPPPPIPAPHVNPAFFPPTQQPPPHHTAYPAPPAHHGLSEIEFEEIMSRNRTVSSSAIARAVQDAANQEYASAIETLVTAISLIKQSKVASDDRCKILISSLQDTLHGIENKSYGASRRERSRSRERPSHHHHHRHHNSGISSGRRRSYSRERDYRDRSRDREYYKERSRSRERDRYREDKYYDDRYKERSGGSGRDMERDHRSGDTGDRGRGESRRSSEREKDRERSRH
ncbi:cleavage and polyadenylation specificity factor subunit 6 [Lepeophtheirus salmonis]|uniref:cleavage and polyadenylation specificity factor subunit 6 n=1 Tax=Lepeophtheirus salmonis TaxID=72036 RepID=UPI001AE91981|nr:cleavage and polyadenylation specificity factor subunit 6-like [Lepeophtheirus salmonis]